LSDLPTEIGLYRLQVVVRTGHSSVQIKILKVWIVDKENYEHKPEHGEV
jgi:hypothetical protein